MTMSVGTCENLQPDRGHPVDCNPSLPCNQCGAQHSWQDYWKGRMTERDTAPDRPLLCDDCLKRADEWHDRWANNRQLSEFGVNDPQEDSDGDEWL